MVLLGCAPLFSAETEEALAKRVYAHLMIRDPSAAVKEAKRSLEHFPESKALQMALIRALSEGGKDGEAFDQWKKTVASFDDEKNNRMLLETLAWGVLTCGEQSNQLAIRLYALLGAGVTHDAKALPVLLGELRGSNALLRSVAIHLAATFGDAPLQDEIERLLREEKVWYVRLEVIKAVGALRMTHLCEVLKEIIGNPKTLIEEKAAATTSLVNMYENLDDAELQKLVKSNRAGLRQLACDAIAYLDLRDKKEELLFLLKDTSADVRMSSLNALGLLRIQVNPEEIETLLKDSSSEVAITAAWLGMLHEKKWGADALISWIEGSNPESRRLASAALAVTGRFGSNLAYKLMKKSTDPYVKGNLALALVGQRVHLEEACDTLFGLFSKEHSELWMWDEHLNPLFRSLAPSRVRHIDQIPHYPKVIDQMVRLELLSVLSMMRHPKAQEAVRGFLQNQTWGVTGVAASTLLEEGDEESLEAVRGLLKDSDEKIRVQAALILAIVGSDLSAVPVLQEAYPHMEREMKVHILEALGHIGDPKTIPFLLKILDEPFQALRVVAASALIQCLYH
jgi:HEAT repeat protein